jgi:hypothetical protein
MFPRIRRYEQENAVQTEYEAGAYTILKIYPLRLSIEFLCVVCYACRSNEVTL